MKKFILFLGIAFLFAGCCGKCGCGGCCGCNGYCIYGEKGVHKKSS